MKWKGRVRNSSYKLENDLPNYVFVGGVNYVKVKLCDCGSLHEIYVKVKDSVVSDCDPMDCSLPGSSVHGILQARILEGVSCPFSKESSQPRS